MSRTSFVIIFLLSASTAAKAATTISESTSGLTLALSTNGDYFIGIQNSDWSFSGNVPGPLQQLKQNTGTDGIGPYDEINFAFSDGGTPKQAGIRVYQQKPVVVFTLSFLAAGENAHAFPTFIRHPAALYRLTNSGWQQHFDASTTDGPLVEFDSGAHTFILSPASNFTVASTSAEPVLASGINPQIQSLPAGFTHRTMLVVDQGINQAFDTWGHALTDLEGKVRQAN